MHAQQSHAVPGCNPLRSQAATIRGTRPSGHMCSSGSQRPQVTPAPGCHPLLSQVGYGDITPTNDAERLFCLAALLIGGLVFGFIVSTIGSMVAAIDRQARHATTRPLCMRMCLCAFHSAFHGAFHSAFHVHSIVHYTGHSTVHS